MIRELKAVDEVPIELLLLADPSETLIKEYLARGTTYTLEEEQKIIGVYVLLPTRPQTLEIVNVAVDEEFQGKGYGKELIMDAIQRAKILGYQTIEIGTGNSGVVQLALYQKCGFRMKSIDKDFFLRHYNEPIFENGIQVIDMVRLSLDL